MTDNRTSSPEDALRAGVRNAIGASLLVHPGLALEQATDEVIKVVERLATRSQPQDHSVLVEALQTKRDYIADAASGALTYADSGEGFKAMAKEDLARIDAILASLSTTTARKFTLGQRVHKTKGSFWRGRVVGFYSTNLTPVGYAVESEHETGSVQIYPEAALEAFDDR